MYGEINVCGIYGRKGIENESESKNEKKGQKMISNKEYKECIKICSAGIYRDIQRKVFDFRSNRIDRNCVD